LHTFLVFFAWISCLCGFTNRLTAISPSSPYHLNKLQRLFRIGLNLYFLTMQACWSGFKILPQTRWSLTNHYSFICCVHLCLPYYMRRK
jgi:hypothetical protein